MKNIQIKGKANAEDTDSISESVYGLSSVTVLALGTFVVGTDAFIVSAFLPSMAEDLAVTPAMAGYSVTAFALAYAVLGPIISTLTSTLKRRQLLVSALVFLGLANIASALAPSFGVLMATRVAAAAAAAAYTPNAGAAAAVMVRPEIRARALAVVIGGLTAATALGIPLGYVVSASLNWRAALMLVGVLSIVAAINVLAVMSKLPGSARLTLGQRLAVLRNRDVQVILPLTVMGMAACYVPYAFTIPVLDALIGSSKSITAMLTLYGSGAIAGNYLSGWATDRTGPIPVLFSAYALMFGTLGAMALASGGFHSPHIFAATLMICWGASSWAQTPAQQHRLISSAPEEASLVAALNSSAIYLGISIGTAIGSHAIQVSVTQTLWYGCALAGVALFYVLTTTSIHRSASRDG
ncbi:Purine efflux pump PbuE [Pigmentiphaga humi]|uniref:Purine efflux pump PbuE n=1 Tax=Pigmentiphaga humi TaxID=2478468 RepID=A0A3P4AYL2_9BURK|nr:MFS transporter [Pigmentiphaga humi]VCU68530.1 Purine efflux pump PbuE [Pigmentiphaga humi]